MIQFISERDGKKEWKYVIHSLWYQKQHPIGQKIWILDYKYSKLSTVEKS